MTASDEDAGETARDIARVLSDGAEVLGDGGGGGAACTQGKGKGTEAVVPPSPREEQEEPTNSVPAAAPWVWCAVS